MICIGKTKCTSEKGLFFELPQDKCLDGSFGAPSKETIDSLEMIGEVLRETIFDLSVPEPSEVKLLSKAITTKVNEHLFAKARELGLNEAVGCLDYAINFPSIVEEVMKRITKLPFLFYTHPESYYEIPQVHFFVGDFLFCFKAIIFLNHSITSASATCALCLSSCLLISSCVNFESSSLCCLFLSIRTRSSF